MLVIGWDPGIVNCAWAVYNFEEDCLEATGVTEGIGKDVTRLFYFSYRVSNILNTFSPDVCAIERYQLRRGKGFIGNMEKVNIMIGILAGECYNRNIQVSLITPSVHKTYAKRHFGAIKGKNGKISTLTCKQWCHLSTEHEADAANIAKYAAIKQEGEK